MTINPNFDPKQYLVKFGYIHTPCRQAIARLASHILDKANFTAKDRDAIRIEIQATEAGLSINFGTKFQDYTANLANELRKQGYQFATAGNGKFTISSSDSADQNQVHREIGNFVVYFLQTWKYDTHSYIRNLYCDTSGGESGINVDEQSKKALRQRFNELHWMYKADNTNAQFVKSTASSSFFRSWAENTKGALYYQYINLLIHSMQLGAKAAPASEKKVSEGKIEFIDNGDLFKLINELTAADKAAILSGDNPYRPGGAAGLNGAGSIEEMLCRMTNYLTKLMTHLDPSDPYCIALNGIFSHATATKQTLNISKGKGIPSGMVGKTIPEYISPKYVEKLAYHMRKMANNSKQTTHNFTTYHDHKQQSKFVDYITDVSFKNENNETMLVDMISMVGIDGRQPSFGLSTFGFADEYNEANQYYDAKSKTFLLEKATTEYTKRWTKVFDSIKSKPDLNRVLMVAVGAGAFDPTSNRDFTKASAQGFMQAAKATDILSHAQQKGIHISFPCRDAGGKTTTFNIFKDAAKNNELDFEFTLRNDAKSAPVLR